MKNKIYFLSLLITSFTLFFILTNCNQYEERLEFDVYYIAYDETDDVIKLWFHYAKSKLNINSCKITKGELWSGNIYLGNDKLIQLEGGINTNESLCVSLDFESGRMFDQTDDPDKIVKWGETKDFLFYIEGSDIQRKGYIKSGTRAMYILN